MVDGKRAPDALVNANDSLSIPWETSATWFTDGSLLIPQLGALGRASPMGMEDIDLSPIQTGRPLPPSIYVCQSTRVGTFVGMPAPNGQASTAAGAQMRLWPDVFPEITGDGLLRYLLVVEESPQYRGVEIVERFIRRGHAA